MRRVVYGFAMIPAVFEGNNLSCSSAGACAKNVHTAFYHFSSGTDSEMCLVVPRLPVHGTYISSPVSQVVLQQLLHGFDPNILQYLLHGLGSGFSVG